MPESSEVRLTTEYLHSKLVNKTITDWEIISGQYKKNKPEGYYNFIDNLPLLVESVKCKGKFIYFTLFNENKRFYILHSLRLSGRWQNYQDDFCRWYIEIENDETIWFRNPRCFATVEFTTDETILADALQKLGPDILTSEFSLPMWRNLIEKYKNKNVTSFLMNQNIISGVGNYIKSEALYYSHISPKKKLKNLSENEIGKLYEAIKIIPRISYNKGGMSKNDFADENGNKGTFETELKIYGKKNAEKLKTADGRMTYWDSRIQK